jgi:arylsulfatase A-like enzyme
LPGISLKPFLTGQGKLPVRKTLVTENYNGYQITDGRYKYSIYELPGHPEMLTDLATNPGETNNYVNDEVYGSIKGNLKNELMRNLSLRGLLPLAEDRTIKNIRAKEKEIMTKNNNYEKNEE